jgi:hypothetical protein
MGPVEGVKTRLNVVKVKVVPEGRAHVSVGIARAALEAVLPETTSSRVQPAAPDDVAASVSGPSAVNVRIAFGFGGRGVICPPQFDSPLPEIGDQRPTIGDVSAGGTFTSGPTSAPVSAPASTGVFVQLHVSPLGVQVWPGTLGVHPQGFEEPQ